MAFEYWLKMSNNNLIFMILFVITILGVLILYKLTDEKNKNPIEKQSSKVTVERFQLVALILIFAVAVAVRVWRFGDVPAGMNQDGAMGAVDALAISQYGTDRFGMWMPAHLTAWGFGQMSALLTYLTVPFIKIFGLSVIVARLPLLLVSLASLYVLYLFGTKLVNKNFGLILLAFAAINPWQITQSRWAIDCNLFPHFLLFGMYFLYLGLKKTRYIFVSMVFFGLSMYSYGVALYTVPIFLAVAFLYLLITRSVKISHTILAALTYILVSLPFLTVMFINIFKLKTINTPLVTMPFFPNSMRSNDILFFSTDIIKQFVANFNSFFNIAFLQRSDFIWNSIPEYATLYICSLPLIIFGMVMLFMKIFKKTEKNAENKLRKNGMFLVVSFFVAALACGLITNNVNINRINVVFYPLIFFAAYGIYELFRRIRFSLVIILVIFSVLFGSFTTAYFAPNEEFSRSFYSGFGKALDYVQEMNYDRIYVTQNTQYETSTNVSEIMTMFFLFSDAKYSQGQKVLIDKQGKQLLPYVERYNYVQFSAIQIDPNEKAVYIINNSELGFFNQSKFEIKTFDYYSAIIPKILLVQK